MDMIVEIQVTQLLTWNFGRSVADPGPPREIFLGGKKSI